MSQGFPSHPAPHDRLPKSSSGQGGSSALRPDAQSMEMHGNTLYVCVYDAYNMCICCAYYVYNTYVNFI